MSTTMESELIDKFGADLWLSRCKELEQVVRFLERSSGGSDAGQWIEFVRFLEQNCSGKYFSNDSQWSNLLNLMQISRKLNHRTVRFRDVIKNRIQIETNAHRIVQLSESARLATIVSQLLKDLETNLSNSKLKLVPLHKFTQSLAADKTKQQIEELCKSRRNLREKCWLLVGTLRVELRNPIFSSSIAQVEDWTCSLGALESDLRQVDEFLSKFQRFLEDLMQLEPLIGAQATSSEHESTQVNKQIATIVADFKSLVGYTIDCCEFLVKVSRAKSTSSKSNELLLLKLVKNRKLANDLLDTKLSQAIDRIDECKNVIEEITRTLRLEFGRFYFVNDIQLMQIIALDVKLVSESPENTMCRELIRKLFSRSIDRFVLDKSGNFVVGVQSTFGEIVLFDESEKPVAIRKRINVYSLQVVRVLEECLRKLQRSLSKILKKSLAKYTDEPLHCVDWTLPVQLVDVSEQVRFCRRVEGFMQQEDCDFDSLSNEYKMRIDKLKLDEEAWKSEDNPISRLKMSVLLSLNIYFATTLAKLSSLVANRQDLSWTWFKCTRYYVKEAIDALDWSIEVQIGDISFTYRFDYLSQEVASGNSNENSLDTYKRLIATKTSERCFLVASHAIGRLKLGTSPFGPAGSGKTETMKAFGRSLGCQVIVHNCDESNDSDSLNRLVWGLAHTGLWCCFDEFNRLSRSTLSSVSATLELVQSGLRESKLTVTDLAGDIMSIDPSAAFFITLNPIATRPRSTDQTKQYKGRRRLPANIRGLFVPVPMVQVQLDTIVGETLLEVSLRARKCENSVVKFDLDPKEAIGIGHKIEAWIRSMQMSTLCREDNRCEWDLRLVIAMMRRFEMSLGSGGSIMETLCASINLEVESRLSKEEQLSFRVSLNSLGFECELDEVPRLDGSSTQHLRSKILEASKSENLTGFAMHLFNQLETHTGVVLVGPAKSGKTSTWKYLASSINTIESKFVHWSALSPKSCSKSTLFGIFELNTRKWTDGLLTRLVREAIELLLDRPKQSSDQVWLILDASIDPEWIECLNSVLDDNRILTLASGERLDFCPAPNKQIKLIFETTDLRYASPATISRLGLVYFESQIDTNLDKIITRQRVELENLLRAYENRLCIIVHRSAYQIPGCSDRTFKYCCSSLSNYENLVDLLTEASSDEPTTLLIENIHLISYEDEWKTRSFLELLRFTLEYDFYYDRKFAERKLSPYIRFILTVSSIDVIDQRLKHLSHIIEVHPDADTCVNVQPIESLERLIAAEQLPSIVTVLNCDDWFTEQTLNLFNRDEVDVFTFRGVEEAKKSVARLEELVSTQSAQKSRSTVFVLEEMQYSLLSNDSSRKLSHLINLIRDKNSYEIRFLFLSRSTNWSDSEGTYWRTVGRMFRVATRRFSLADVSSVLESFEVRQEWASEKIIKLVKEVELDHLMRLFGVFFKNFRETVSKQSKIFSSGLLSLKSLDGDISKLQMRQEASKEEILKKRKEIEQYIVKIDAKLNEARTRKLKIDDFKKVQETKTLDISRKKQLIEAEMAQVKSMIESSKAEISKYLKPEALNEIKSLRAPPKTIKDILDVLFVLLGEKELSWSAMKSYLTRYTLRDELTKYDFQNNLSPGLLQEIETQIKQHQESFNIQQAKRASTAVVPIVKWIQATLEYGKVMVRLRPLNIELAGLQEESNEIERKITRYKQEQQSLTAQIESDTRRLDLLRAEQSSFEENFTKIGLELDRMKEVLVNLDNQIGRWRDKLAKIDKYYGADDQVRLALLAAALVIRCKGTACQDLCSLLNELSAILAIETKHQSNVEQRLIDLTTGCVSVDAPLQTTSDDDDDDRYKYMLPLFLIRASLVAFEQQPAARFDQVAFVDLSGNTSVTKDELIGYLSGQEIVCAREDLVYVGESTAHPTSTTTGNENDIWLDEIRIGLQLGKVVAVDVSHLCQSRDDLLNLMAVVRGMRRNHITDESVPTPSQSRVSGFVFVGYWNDSMYRPIEQFVLRLPYMSSASEPNSVGKPNRSGSSRAELISEQIVERLLRYHNSDLARACDRTLKEYRAKESSSKLMEASLLEKLARVELAATRENNSVQSNDDHCGKVLFAHSELIKVLNELHRICVDLEGARLRWQTSRRKLEAERDNYIEFAVKAAQIFDYCLADLSSIDLFYEVSIKTFIQMLIEAREKSANTCGLYEDILINVLRPMRPSARRSFIAKLQKSAGMLKLMTDEKDVETSKRSARAMLDLALRRASSLSMVLSTSLTKLCENNNNDDDDIVLVLVQHDATKASPQLEVDAYFRASGSSDSEQVQFATIDSDSSCRHSNFSYSKLYATGEQCNQLRRLELEVARSVLLSSDASGRRVDKQTGATTTTSVCCICIANAHLASHWVTNNLRACVRSKLTQLRARKKVLLILIGERDDVNGNHDQSGTCDRDSSVALVQNNNKDDQREKSLAEDTSRVVELSAMNRLADVRYWHDELALNFADRYSLFMDTIGKQVLARLEVKVSTGRLSGIDRSILMDLIEDLVRRVCLLHTSCQQLTLVEVPGKGFVWSGSYNFGYELLRFALGVFEHLLCADVDKDLRWKLMMPTTTSSKHASSNGQAEESLRDRLCRYLRDVVYTATHLETSNDEELFLKLLTYLFGEHRPEQVDRFVSEKDSPSAASARELEQWLIQMTTAD